MAIGNDMDWSDTSGGTRYNLTFMRLLSFERLSENLTKGE
jgi:hypothetical protein